MTTSTARKRKCNEVCQSLKDTEIHRISLEEQKLQLEAEIMFSSRCCSLISFPGISFKDALSFHRSLFIISFAVSPIILLIFLPSTLPKTCASKQRPASLASIHLH